MNTIISNSEITISVNHTGAELTSLKGTNSQREYIWEGDSKFWGKHSPILFPIVGTLKNNEYFFEGNKYTLSRHGFARDMEFVLKNQNANEISFVLESNESTLSKFPFKFELQVTYALYKKEVTVIYTIISKEDKMMPFSIGGHPAFALKEPIESYSLEFEHAEILKNYELEADLISEKVKTIELQNKRLPLSYSLFEKDALILKTPKSKEISLLENQTPILRFKYNDFPNFGIWTKKGAPFICLEPWAGYSDTWNSNGMIMNKEGIQKLNPNSSTTFRFSIEIL